MRAAARGGGADSGQDAREREVQELHVAFPASAGMRQLPNCLAHFFIESDLSEVHKWNQGTSLISSGRNSEMHQFSTGCIISAYNSYII
jgi:hypothetical protein